VGEEVETLRTELLKVSTELAAREGGVGEEALAIHAELVALCAEAAAVQVKC